MGRAVYSCSSSIYVQLTLCQKHPYKCTTGYIGNFEIVIIKLNTLCHENIKKLCYIQTGPDNIASTLHHILPRAALVTDFKCFIRPQ